MKRELGHSAREAFAIPEEFPGGDSRDDLDSLNPEWDPDSWSDPLSEEERPWDDHGTPSAREIRDQRALLERERREFRKAAERVAAALAEAPEVRRIVLFGSVAEPPPDEVPRFHEYRRAGIRLPHECKDLDLAVGLDDLGNLDGLRKRASGAPARAVIPPAGRAVVPLAAKRYRREDPL